MAVVRGLGGNLIWVRPEHVYRALESLLVGILAGLSGHLFHQGRVHALPERPNLVTSHLVNCIVQVPPKGQFRVGLLWLALRQA